MILISLILSAVAAATNLDPCDEIVPVGCLDTPTLKPDGTTKTWAELETRSPLVIGQVRDELLAIIDSSVSDPVARKKMVDRVRRVKIQTDWSGSALGEGINNPDKNEVQINRDSLKVPSLFSLVQVLGHEMTHSIDPCALVRSIGEKGAHPAVIEFGGPPLRIEKHKNHTWYFYDYSRFRIASEIRALPMTHMHSCLLQENSLGLPEVDKLFKEGNEHMASDLETLKHGRHNIHPFCNFTRHNEAYCDLLAYELLARIIAKHWKHLSAEQV